MIGFFLKIFFLLLISAILSLIPANRSFSPREDGIKIFIVSNGVHTDFVLPVKTSIINWHILFSGDHFNDALSYAPYIAFGWGDKGFYLKTPEWKDLRLQTAIVALFMPSVSAMHVTLWPEPKDGKLSAMVYLTEAEYQKIVNYILDSFEWGPDKRIIKIDHPGYGDYDLFFESSLRFHIFRTCNVWTSQGLKKAGVRTPLWTPYDRPILYQLSRIDSN